MTPSRPYFVRAVYEWLNDNQLTAHIMVDANYPGAEVPQQYVQDGRIILNIAPGAVRDLFMDNNEVSFSARFGGIPVVVRAPTGSILGIYARENGQGMFFDDDEEFDPPPAPTPPEPEKEQPKRPSLRVVK